jgi:NAD(P)-dependent dehydrogenase (short-subunit alcohol dehydrogenase family)
VQSSPKFEIRLCLTTMSATLDIMPDRISSGIGRSVAVHFAREGADVSIVFLQEEQKDAEETKKLVEREGKECQLIAGSLMEEETCRDAVKKHVDK